MPIGLLTLFSVTIGVSLKLISDSANELERANHVVDNVREAVIGTAEMVGSALGAALFPKDSFYA